MARETVPERRVPEDERATYESLHAKLLQLEALLVMTCGEAGVSFSNMNDDLRDNYMAACADMARDCVKLTRALSDVVYKTNVPEVAHG